MRGVLYSSVSILFEVIGFLVLIRVILSWLPFGDNNPIVRAICSLTDPLLEPIRKMLDKSPIGGGMMIDFSPIILYLILQVVETIIKSLII